jgi:type IX secretion system PorP/SprF family membrane protein
MQKKYLLSIFIITALCGLKAQDVHFSQINESPMFISPANTGFYNGYIRFSVNAKNQWNSMGTKFGSAYNTGAVSVDGGLFKSKRRKAFLGMGLTLIYDQAGVAQLKKTNMLLHLSGITKVTKHSVFSAGVAVGVNATNANYNKLTFASQFDGNYLVDNAALNGEQSFRQFTTTDIGTGIAYEYSKVKTDSDHDDLFSIKFAFGAFHLNKPKQDYSAGASYRLPVRLAYSLSSNYDFEDTKFTISPSILYQQQGKYWEVLGGTYVKYRVAMGTKVTGQKTQNAFGVGLFYRAYDAFIPKIMYEMGDVAFGFSYDVNVSPYRNASRYNGGLEFCFRYNNLASSLFDAKREFK